MWLLIAFIAVPMIEIALFIQVGGAIGIWATLLIVLVTAIIGSRLVRNQGLQELSKLRGSFQDMRDPSEPLANGAMILFAGALLLTPGFFTDAVGFSLLIPQVRAASFRWIKSRIQIVEFSGQAQPGRQGAPGRPDAVIDGEFSEVDPESRATHRPSGWTQH